MSLTDDILRQWLMAEAGLRPEELSTDALLFSECRLDSLILLDLISFVEDRCGRRVAWQQVTLENFDSIARILAFVERSAP